jgi:hypothetical protein
VTRTNKSLRSQIKLGIEGETIKRFFICLVLEAPVGIIGSTFIHVGAGNSYLFLRAGGNEIRLGVIRNENGTSPSVCLGLARKDILIYQG